jgi:hypothetical protein
MALLRYIPVWGGPSGMREAFHGPHPLLACSVPSALVKVVRIARTSSCRLGPVLILASAKQTIPASAVLAEEMRVDGTGTDF